MDIQQQNRTDLEPIQEESEEEDEIEGSKTGEEEEEEEEEEEGSFQIQGGVETAETMATDKSAKEEDDDDAPALRVMRPRRLSRSHSQESFPRMQPTSRREEEMSNFSVSDRSSRGVDLSDEATPPKQARLGNKKSSSSGELRRKTSTIRPQRLTPPKPSALEKTSGKRHKKEPLDKGLFPEWVVKLMVNIEEATTHQLLVE